MYHPFGKELLDWLAMCAVHITLMSIFLYLFLFVLMFGQDMGSECMSISVPGHCCFCA